MKKTNSEDFEILDFDEFSDIEDEFTEYVDEEQNENVPEIDAGDVIEADDPLYVEGEEVAEEYVEEYIEGETAYIGDVSGLLNSETPGYTQETVESDVEEIVEYIEEEGQIVEYAEDEEIQYIEDEDSEEYIDGEEPDYTEDEYYDGEDPEYIEDEDIEYSDIDEDEEEEEENVKPLRHPRKDGNSLIEKLGVTGLMSIAAAVIILIMAGVIIFKLAGDKKADQSELALRDTGMLYASLSGLGLEGIEKMGMYAASATLLVDDYVEGDSKTVAVSFLSMSKDIKIKFFRSGMLLTGYEFEVVMEGGDNDETVTLTDDDMDGVIYSDEMTPGTYVATVTAMDGFEFSPTEIEVEVKAELAYEAVDVSDQVQVATQAIMAVEDQSAKEVEEEDTTLEDTVEWVESTRTVVYTKINKDDIVVPTIASNMLNGVVSNGYYAATRPETYMQMATIVRDDPPTSSGNNDGGNGEPPSGNNDGGNGEPPSGNETPALEIESYKIDAEGTDPSEANAGDTRILTPIVEYTKKGDTQSTKVDNPSVKWESSDNTVASIYDGEVEFLKAGTVTISLSYTYEDSHTETWSYTYTVKDDPKNIWIDGAAKTTYSVKVTTDNTVTLKPEGRYGSGTTVTFDKLVYEIGDPSVISYDSATGTLKGLKAGNTTITFYIDKTNYSSVKCVVSVTVDPSIEEQLKSDTVHQLQVKNTKETVYIKNGDGSYSVAKYADYYTASDFYIEDLNNAIYTGWQTIGGNTYFYDKNNNKVTGDQVIQGIEYHFTQDGILAMDTNGKRGIDVSVYQGNIDWNAVKNSGIEFVIIRAGFRGYTQGTIYEDTNFRKNLAGANAAGLKVGVYFFSQAVTEAEAVEEASMVIGIVKNYTISYPIFIDSEYANTSHNGRADSLDKATRTAICKAFCQTIRNSGYTAGVYASKSWWLNNIDYNQLNGYVVWNAQYASASTLPGRYDLWQNSSKGSVSGISGNVDLDFSYMGY